ncbi:MAG TPA: ABC transporter ATP-binding protein, partial [Elusimicrobiales bacterium]|nr:ABC transporter ATP-binding protein [Elusimicrobiales bacterium]
MKDNNAIMLRDVKRSFGKHEVLCGVTGEIEKGKTVGLLGRNAEGKTTLFKLLLDILAADSGEIKVGGLVPDGSGAIRKRTGYIPERPAFHDFMTIKEVFEFRAGFFPSWDMEKALSTARHLELDTHRPVKSASKGTLAKVAWVCAVAHNPEILLLDEPTSGLDALVRSQLLAQLVGELHGAGKTIFVADHRMEELAGVLDEVWVLSGGVISARYDAQILRSQSCKITGRLKHGARMPDIANGVKLDPSGEVASLALFGDTALKEVTD